MATEKSIYATGKRKNAIARTWIQPGTGVITVNDRPADEYFTVSTARTILRQPLTLTNNLDAFDIKIKVHGGGISGQAGAVRHGITKALILFDPDLRPSLKRAGFVKRDPREKERSPFALMDMEREEGKVLACCCTPESDMVIEADIDVDDDFAGYPVMDFIGTVTEFRQLSPTIKGIFFELDKPMEFQAGQYINLKIPGVEGSRAFSIANKPSEASTLELHVRLVPDGAGTTYLHEQLEVGDTLDVSGPYGQFFVRKSDDQGAIFIAGGSGLSSPQSMILDMLEEGDGRQITLLQGARNVSELYNRELFENLDREFANFTYVPALNAPEPGDDWQGFTGFVHEAAQAHFNGRFDGNKAYLCGPPPMIDAAITTLMQGRLFERDIHMERFVTAADGAEEQSRSALFKRI